MKPTKGAATAAPSPTKKCKKCSRRKGLHLFARHSKYGQQSWCKRCMATYKKGRITKMNRLLRRFKTFKGCSTCGYREHPDALQFHHRDPQPGDVSVSILASMSLRKQRIKEELAKCDVMCSNCHTIHEAVVSRARFA